MKTAGFFVGGILVLGLVGALTSVQAEVLPALPTPTVLQQLAPGVSYQSFSIPAVKGKGTAQVHMVTVDLRQPQVAVDLLYSGIVADANALSKVANERGAIAAVNADFFNISATQTGITPTSASVGPAIASGEVLKGAVPIKQRFGPALPSGVTVEDVIGVGVDHVARIGKLTLQGTVQTPQGTYALNGLNQYAIAQGGIGAFNWRWGTVSRLRSICGTDNKREDPCSKDIYEVTVSQGRVVTVSAVPGAGSIATDTMVLVGREAGAAKLRQLQIGDQVEVNYGLVSSQQVPYAFAVGCQPLLRDGKPIPGLENVTVAIRSAAGISADGQTLYLISLNRNAKGLTYAELADVLLMVGATSGVNLDGGGSSTLVVREPEKSNVTVTNMAPTEVERPIPNGIGVFIRP